jgi:hypothetical protein
MVSHTCKNCISRPGGALLVLSFVRIYALAIGHRHCLFSSEKNKLYSTNMFNCEADFRPQLNSGWGRPRLLTALSPQMTKKILLNPQTARACQIYRRIEANDQHQQLPYKRYKCQMGESKNEGK